MKNFLTGFALHNLDGGGMIWSGQLPTPLLPDAAGFESLWQSHPQEFHEIKMLGRLVKTPRWQQAFGKDYHYTGRVNQALPLPPSLTPFLEWAQASIAPELNGLLLNWYDGQFGHYIGRHRDSIQNMIPGAPIVTISLGGERTFRLRRWPARLKGSPIDLPARNGTVFVMPWETNITFTHEVPASSRNAERRISITIRAFAR